MNSVELDLAGSDRIGLTWIGSNQKLWSLRVNGHITSRQPNRVDRIQRHNAQLVELLKWFELVSEWSLSEVIQKQNITDLSFTLTNPITSHLIQFQQSPRFIQSWVLLTLGTFDWIHIGFIQQPVQLIVLLATDCNCSVLNRFISGCVGELIGNWYQ